MNQKLRRIALLLAFVIMLGSMEALAWEGEPPQIDQMQAIETIDENETVRAVVLFEADGAAAAAGNRGEQLFSRYQRNLERDHVSMMEALQDAAPELEVAHEFTVFFSGVSVDVPYGDLEALRELDGVADVWVTTTYALPTTEEATADAYYAVAASALASDYTGQGTLIAVLDTGVNLNHEAFGVYEGLLGETALSKAETQSAGTSVSGTYVSQKIPFAYDYGDGDGNVTDVHGHGTHVAAIAAGYAPEGEGDSGFSGAAPGAQLAVMKIFGDSALTTTTDVYFAALEDAYLLGADVISMSLGTACGFTHDANLDGALFGDIYEMLDEAGIILCAAAGNHGSQADHNVTDADTVLAGYTDYGTVASPSTYLGNTSVASATNYENPSYVLQVAGVAYSYTEPTGEDGGMVSELGGQTYDYVLVSGNGTEADFEAVDVAGKIAVVSRGGLSFPEKVQNAGTAGAVGLVVYNNQDKAVTMRCPDPDIPVVLVSKSAGAALKAAANKTIYIPTNKMVVPNDEALTVCDYSAWGTTPDLTIAPAVSGIGDNVYSADRSSNTGYRYLSGTSMATPNVAGQFAVILSYLKVSQPDLTKLQRAELAEDLAYSTAEILGSETDLVSVRRQGSGLMDASAAVESDVYITEPLQELGDDPSETGVYKMTLEVASPAALDCPSEQFSDLDTSKYYHDAIDYGLRVGLFNGMGNGTFAPNGSLTRGQMVTVLYRLAGEPTVSGKSTFTDVKKGAYYEKAVTWAQQNGIVNGVTLTTFEPDSPITRQQLVTILYRYLGSPATEMDISGYVDLGKVHDYAVPAMKWAVKNGIINSYSLQRLELNPLGKATRAQYAAILYRYLKAESALEHYDLSAIVMADSAVVQEDGTAVNLMEMQELDCSVTFSCGDSLVLDTCGSTTVTVELRLTEESKAMLRQNFENGTYVEGYITMENEDTAIHATFLSFFGDWEQAPILEEVDFRDVAEAENLIDDQGLAAVWNDLVPVNIGANMAQLYCGNSTYTDYFGQYITLGDNAMGDADYDERHIALSSGSVAYAGELVLKTMQLRNAKTITLTVTDAQSGTVYHRDTRAYRSKSTYSTTRGAWQYSSTFTWTPDDANGRLLASGTEVIVTVSASLHGEAETVQWSFPLVIDSAAPVVTCSRADNTLTITASDNEYLAGLTVCDESGNELLTNTYSEGTTGVSHKETVDLTGLSGSVTITAVDYATNVCQVTVPIS